MRACSCPGAWACACACSRVALNIKHARRVRHIVSFMAFGVITVIDISSLTARFSEKVFEHILCVLIFSTNFVYNILILKEFSEILS